ncbi:MAG: guanylate kinase [Rhodospirillales bacterium]|nr:guanylate kinase [Rhodospirillales bacterium]
MPDVNRRGLMLVLSSPSGAGKTTISRRLLDEEPNLAMSVSATTRPMRPNEVGGVDYHFIDKDRFQAMVSAGEFLEHATVFGNSYGTPRGPVEKALSGGRDILFDVDWQGAQLLNAAMPDDLVSVFILPPSADELHRRLINRASDPEGVVCHRMTKASDEMSHWDAYDYVVVNEEIDESVAGVRSILHGERLRRGRQVGMAQFVNAMRDELDRG